MSNVRVLYEGPYRDKRIEQIAQSDTGRWFRRLIDKKTLRPNRWMELAAPPIWMDSSCLVYGPRWRPATKAELAKFHSENLAWVFSDWRDPTPQECDGCLKGLSSALFLRMGPYKLRLPEAAAERSAKNEQALLSAALRCTKAVARTSRGRAL